MIDWTELLSNVLIAMLSVAVPVLTKFAADWMKAKAEEAKAWNPGLIETLEKAAEYGVKVAEQMGYAGILENFYADKRSAAIDMAEKWLLAKDMEEFDVELLVGMIEKAVLENFPKNK